MLIKNEDRRGVMGFEVAESVMYGILVISILAFVFIITTAYTRDAAGEKNTFTVYFTNESLAKDVNDSGIYSNISAASNSRTITDCTLTIFAARNQTGAGVCPTVNYTTNKCGVKYIGTTAGGLCNHSLWMIDGKYTYSADSPESDIFNNMSKAQTNFFQQLPATMTIIGIVVLILAVILIVLVVMKIRSPEGVGFRSGETLQNI